MKYDVGKGKADLFMKEKSKAYKILLWGLGSDYSQNINSIKYQEMLGNVHIVGVTDTHSIYPCLDGYPFIKVEELNGLDIDYIVVTTTGYYKEICTTILRRGIERKKIIPASAFSIPSFNFFDYVRLLESNITIIAQNCWGGITYHCLGMKFNSPFINMFFHEKEYIKLLHSLKTYLSYDIEFKNWGYEQILKRCYPVVKLGDIEIQFNHYKTYEEGKEKWDQRLGRINWDNLFVMMATANRKLLEEFDALPFRKKVCFVPFQSDCPSAHTVTMNESQAAKISITQFANGIASGKYPDYDVIRMLYSGQVNHDRYSNIYVE